MNTGRIVAPPPPFTSQANLLSEPCALAQESDVAQAFPSWGNTMKESPAHAGLFVSRRHPLKSNERGPRPPLALSDDQGTKPPGPLAGKCQ